MMPITTGQAAAGFLKYLAEPAARSLALGCLAAIALAAFRVKRVPLRLFVWTMTLCAALAMPFLGAFLPRMTFSVPAQTAVIAQNAAQWFGRNFRSDAKGTVRREDVASSSMLANRVAMPARGEVKGLSATRKASHVDKARSEQQKAIPAGALLDGFTQPVRDIHATHEIILPMAGRAQAQKGFSVSWIAVALGIYLAVTAVFFARLLFGMFFSWRMERASEEIHEREAIRLARMRACMGGLERTPRLAETKMLSVPATMGVLHPVILLPMDWREWDEATLDSILAHEVSHVARRDALTQRLSLIHRAIFWFSPLSWWIDRQITELAEEASDEAALAGGADRTRYAETLLGFFAELEAAPGRIHWEGISMANGCRAEKRVERILSWKGPISMKKQLAVMIVAVAAPLIIFAASVHPLIASAQDKPQQDGKNVIVPGGPKAPALPKAPKGGVASGVNGGVTAVAPIAPALASAPEGGAAAPALAPTPKTGPVAPASMTPPDPFSAPAVAGPIGARSVRPALMSVPGAPEHPPIVPGPIAGDPFAPSSATPAVASPTPYASFADISPAAMVAPEAPQSIVVVGSSVSVQDAEEQLRAAKKALRDVGSASSANVSALRAAQQSLAEARTALAEARAAMREAQEQSASGNTIINGSISMGSGPRYVMMYGNSNDISMSGSDEDLEHAQRLRKKMGGGDLIWFEHDEKSYVITDPAFIAKAKELFAPEEALGKQQEDLGRQQEALGAQQEKLGEQMKDVKVKVRDITPELEEIRARLKELQATGATQRELGRLQSELGQLQGEVGRSQSRAGAGQGEIGRQQGELGRKQGELGRRQGELGRQQGELARKAARELRGMFDDAIAKGIAKPE